MSADHLDRFERLFRAASLLPPEEHADFLDAACADDVELRRQLEEFLEAHLEAEEEAFLSEPAVKHPGSGDAVAALESIAEEDMVGQRLGPYVVLRLVGHGGMGDVYYAKREAPFKRYVALKIIRRGMDTKEVLHRFSMERQILASLDHPNIARLIDGGMTEDGRPYFAMAYVEGIPITTYCDRHYLGVNERLRLFQTVCQTVHYAHQNLVLHRDLKPSNIMVTEKKEVKLLDFGIAKLLNPSMSPMTMPITRTGLQLMTPAYASPEQVRGDILTTASDVYSLGIILYELLTGHRPYRLNRNSPAEIQRIVCEETPERPSTKITRIEQITDSDGQTMQITPGMVCAARDTSAERLKRSLRGDLDNIVLMALRKESNLRYASAEQFGEDIGRYLMGMPIVARAGTMGYRINKFIKRHRTGVAAATIVVLALVAGLGTALWQAGEAGRERERATEALGRAEEVTDFLIGLFEASDPAEARGEEITARELLERGASRAEELSGQPAVQGQMLDAMGRVYQHLGLQERAQQFLDRALSLRRQYAGEESVEAATGLAHLADLYRVRGYYPEAESLFHQALSLQRRLLGDEHPEITQSLIGLGRVLQDRGDFEGAEPLFRQALEAQQRRLGGEYPETIRTQSELARVLYGKADYDAAEVVLQQTLALREKVYGAVHPEIAENIRQLASLYAARDSDFSRSETLHRRALDILEKVYGEGHPAVAKSLTHVATSLYYQKRFDEAEQLLRRALAINRVVLDPTHPDIGTTLNTLGLIAVDQDSLEKAEAFFLDALENYRLAFGARHHYTAAIIGNLADVARERGGLEKAETLLRESLTIRREALGEDHPFVAGTMRLLAALIQQRGRFEDAEALHKEALAIYQGRQDAEDKIKESYGALAELYERWGKKEEADRYRALQAGDGEK